MNLLLACLLIFLVRLASVFIVQTYYVPDEYWQSLEVAHKLTFGYGHITWEWIHGIRSYIYPLVFAGVYKILAFFNLDTAHLLIILPRVLQACLTAYSDYRFYTWTGKKKWALFLIIIPWFWFYTGSRTLANTLETSLTTIALSYFPWHGECIAYLWPAALCCFLRPTAVVIWIPLILYHVQKSRFSVFELILKRFLIIGILVASICIGVDTYMHGKWIVTPLEFLKYNVLNNIGSFYGSHPWYWYFTVGLPTVLGINLFPFLFGIMETIRNREVYEVRKQLLITIFLSLSVLSAVEHKEFRFVTSLMPLCLYITADSLSRWSYNASRKMIWFATIFIILGNVLPAWYASTVHQRGPIELMPKLQEIARDYRDEHNNRASILYLMPCHSTPYYSHIHENVTMRFLTCEPNLQNKDNYKDEADLFFDSPVHWLNSHIPSYPRTAMPSHVVMFEPLSTKIKKFLLNYKILHNIVKKEATENITSQKLFNEWSILKRFNMEAVLKNLQDRNGNRILVYQRLRAGEENAFNRDEYKGQVDKPEGFIHDNNEDAIEGEKNLFN